MGNTDRLVIRRIQDGFFGKEQRLLVAQADYETDTAIVVLEKRTMTSLRIKVEVTVATCGIEELMENVYAKLDGGYDEIQWIERHQGLIKEALEYLVGE